MGVKGWTMIQRFSFLSAVAGFALMAAQPAQAGFEWKPVQRAPIQPPEQQAPAAPAEPSIAAAPAAPVEPATPVLTPEPAVAADTATQPGMKSLGPTQKTQPPVPADLPPTDNAAEKPVAPDDIVWSEAPAAPEQAAPENDSLNKAIAQTLPVPEAIKTSPETAFAVAEGFGKDIPLVLALRQIVPPSYAYRFQNKSDAGLRLSWQGGRPWNQVLNDALAPLGRAAVIDGQSVTIAGGAADMGATEMTVAQDIPMPLDQQPSPAFVETASKPEPAPLPRPVIRSEERRRWETRPGMTLRDTLEDWGRLGGVEVEWSSAYDYPIENAFRFEGTIEQAIDAILSLYAQDYPRPNGKLYPNLPEGPSVLIVN